MTRDEVVKLFKFLSDIYPLFMPSTKEALSNKVDSWHFALKEQCYKDVMHSAKRYILDNKYPPSVADLVVKQKRDNDLLDRIKKWEADAVDNPYRESIT